MDKKIIRLYTGTDGESHFEEIEIRLRDEGVGGIRPSEFVKATGILFREIAADFEHSWHNAPRRQYVILLEGAWEIEIGDGIKHQFGPGGILLAEDTTGRGHISRTLNNQPRKVAVVTLD